MIDSMFQAGTDAALDDLVRRPRPDLPPQEGEFSFLKAVRGVPRGVASGAAKTLAFGAEITGAFGDVEGAMGYSGGGMFRAQTDQEKQQAEQARRKLLDSGPSFSNEAGDLFRQRAKDIMPDPTTTHASEQVIAGITEFATQAIGYSLTTGPAAPFLLGGDVGMAEADKLKQQGVDLATRTKAGAVAGVTAGASIAIPVAVPSSIAKTAVAVAVGGPGSFVAQNVAERAILQHAGYDKIASQYDPFDPVGLVLSTVVPAGFGAMAVRGARIRPGAVDLSPIQSVVQHLESRGRQFGADGAILEGPQTKHGTAKGDMQVIDTTATDPGYGVRPADPKIMKSGTKQQKADELARVGRDYIAALEKEYGGDQAKALAAYNWGPGNLNKALAKAEKTGADWRSLLPEETRNYVAEGTGMLRDQRIGATAGTDGVAAARVRQTAAAVDSYRLTPDGDIAGMTRHQQAMERAHDQMAAGEPVRVNDLVQPFRALEAAPELPAVKVEQRDGGWVQASVDGGMVGGTVKDGALRITHAEVDEGLRGKGIGSTLYSTLIDAAHQKGLRVFSDATVETPAVRVYDALQRRGYDVRRTEGGGEIPPSPEAPQGAVYGRGATEPAYEVLPRMARAEQRLSDLAAAVGELRTAVAEPAPLARTTPAARTAEPSAPAKAAPQAEPSKAEGADAAPDAAALDKSADQLAADMPDLMVQLDGMDSPVRVADLLERVKAEAKDDVEASSLLDVAATCFLRQQ